MSIEQLKIHNFKTISRLNLDLNDSFTNVICLVGENGSAKTSVLSLIAEAIVSKTQLTFPDSPETGKRYRIVSAAEIYNGRKFYSIEMRYKGKVSNPTTFKKLVGERNLPQKEYREVIQGLNLNNVTESEISSDTGLLPMKTYLAKNVFLIRPSHRFEFDGMDPAILNDPAKISSKKRLKYEMPYSLSVAHSGSNVQELLLDMLFDFYVGYAENAPALDKVSSILQDVTGKNYGRLQIAQAPYRSVVFEHGGQIDRLSQGELDLLVTISNIISRQSYIYRQYSQDELNENRIESIFDIPGMVIIDEVDLHLHPRAQEKYLKILTNTFPNIQFIVSTHSPFVVRGLPQNSKAINLPSGQVFEDDFSAMDIDSITNKIFKYEGGFSVEFSEKIKDFRNKIVHGDASSEELSNLYRELATSEAARNELDLILASYGTTELSIQVRGA